MKEDKSGGREVMSNCPFCGKALGGEKITMIQEESAKTIFHITCPRCKTAAIMMVLENQKGLAGVGVLTDLDKEEVVEKISNRIISSDEIIDTYRFLNI